MSKGEQRVKAFYRVTIGVDGMVDELFGKMLASRLFQLPPKTSALALDSIWDGVVDISFRSAFTHFEVIERANEIMAEYPNVLSMDIFYQFPYDFNPGRAVLRQDEPMEIYDSEIEWRQQQ